MKILNVKPFLFLFVLSFLGEGRSLALALALADTAKDKCTFISPFAMEDILQKKYPSQIKYYKTVDYLTYVWETPKKDVYRLKKCEVDLLYTITKNKDKKKYLNKSHNSASIGPNITGGDYITDKFYLLSQCQMHACISNIHSDIFDRQGHLIVSMMYIYPSPDTSSPQGQQLADMLDGKHKEHYYPLEAWVGIRKDYNTPELRTFIREAFEKLQKGSGATIVAVHGMSKE